MYNDFEVNSKKACNPNALRLLLSFLFSQATGEKKCLELEDMKVLI